MASQVHHNANNASMHTAPQACCTAPMHQQERPCPQTGSLVHATRSGRAAPVGASIELGRVDGHAQARSGRTTRCFLTCQASAHRCCERGDVRMSRGHAVYDKRNPPDVLLQLPSDRFGRLSPNLHRNRTAVRVGSIESHSTQPFNWHLTWSLN